MDLEVLAALQNRDSWDRYSRFVKTTSLTEEAANIYLAMGEWYKSNPNIETINWNSFAAWFILVRHAKMDKERQELHRNLIEILEKQEIDPESIRPLLDGLTKRDYASRIADEALRIADGDRADGDFTPIANLLDQFERELGKADSYEKDLGEFSVEALTQISEPGLTWRLDCLNDGAGDLRQGDFVMVGKRPDTGGTTFVASEVSYMAEQLPYDQCVLWLNNEEQGDKVRSRILQAALGWSSDDLQQNMAAAMEEYELLMGGNRNKIRVFDRARIHVKDAEQLIKKLDPGLIVVDQLWKIKGFENESEVTRQTLLANWAREICKEYAPLIAVHQLGGEAEDELFPLQDTLYGSKTGIQGEADLIIMLGRKWSKGTTRGIFLPKNKMLTPRDRSMRNGKWEVEFDADHARFHEH